jgi:hypothetical protein
MENGLKASVSNSTTLKERDPVHGRAASGDVGLMDDAADLTIRRNSGDEACLESRLSGIFLVIYLEYLILIEIGKSLIVDGTGTRVISLSACIRPLQGFNFSQFIKIYQLFKSFIRMNLSLRSI